MFLNKKQQGQGLVEVIIAVSIITTGIVGVLSLTTSSLSSTETSIKQIVAANLAREGVEVVRDIRDSNWLAGNDWLTGLSLGTDYNGTVEFDVASKVWSMDFTASNISDDATKLYRDIDGVYSHDSGGEYSGYRRFIQMWEIYCKHRTSGNTREPSFGSTCNANENIVGIKVLSTVSWQEKGKTKTFEVEENIYNWHDIY